MALCRVVLVALFCSCLQIEVGKAVHLRIMPETFHRCGQQNLALGNFMCRMEDKDKGITRIEGLELQKNGKTVVNVDALNYLHYHHQDKRFEADGYIDQNNTLNSYLYVRLGYPKEKDTGNYSCVLWYYKDGGNLTNVRANGAFTFLDLDDIFDNVESALSDGEARVKLQGGILDELLIKSQKASAFSAEIQDKFTISATDSKIIIFPYVKMDISRGFNSSQSQIVETKSKTSSVHPHYKHVKKISDIQTGGYFPDTGAFTAETNGLYVFNLAIVPRCTCDIQVTLLNGYHILFQLAAGNKRYYDQMPLSTVAHLEKGDTVRAILVSSKPQSFYGEQSSYFSGYLLHQLE